MNLRYVLTALALGADICCAADASLYTRLDSFSLSKLQPIYETVNDWQDRYEGGDFAETFNAVEMGFRWNNLRVGYLVRYDWRLQLSQDAALFYYQQKNKLKPQTSRVYEMDIDVFHQRSQGIAVHYDWQPMPALTLTGSVAILKADALTDGRLGGQTQFLEGGRYSGQLELDYLYVDDIIFDRPLNGDFHGNGYVLDLALEYRPTESAVLYARTRDLVGRIYWEEVPRTVSQAVATPRKTENPFKYYKRAAISGTESYADFVQHLPQRFELGGSYQHGSWRYGLDAFIYPDQTYFFPKLTKLYQQWEFSLQGEPGLRALGFQIANPYFQLELMTDSLSYKEAHFLKLSLGARILF